MNNRFIINPRYHINTNDWSVWVIDRDPNEGFTGCRGPSHGRYHVIENSECSGKNIFDTEEQARQFGVDALASYKTEMGIEV